MSSKHNGELAFDAHRGSLQNRTTLEEAVALAQKKRDGFVRVPRSFIRYIIRHLTGAEVKAALVVYLETVGRDLDRTGSAANAIPWLRFQDWGALAGQPPAAPLNRWSRVRSWWTDNSATARVTSPRRSTSRQFFRHTKEKMIVRWFH